MTPNKRAGATAPGTYPGSNGTAIQQSVADEINAEHEAALRLAGDAIEHAKRAGELLLAVKGTLPHGEFGAWLTENVVVSARQAQRYMGAALGKPLPIRMIAKNDTVSHLPPETADEYVTRSARLQLGALKKVLDDPDCTLEQAAWIAREAEAIRANLYTLNIEALREMGRCLIELKALTGLNDSSLLAVLNDGSLVREAEKKVVEFEAAA